MQTIIITGVAGFIGSHLTLALLNEYENCLIVGIDNMNDYYDVSLKEERLQMLIKNSGNRLIFKKMDISNKEELKLIFCEYKPDIVVNLAAQAGVRYSITNPDVYLKSNIIGFYNVLEVSRYLQEHEGKIIKHIVFASSSSVYGNNNTIPFSENDNVDMPVSLYAATKKSNELLAYSYSKLYGMPCSGVRFFTVYGPLGRPDMAYFKFTKNMIEGRKIQIYNYGHCKRDFTYIDDVVEGVMRIINSPPLLTTGNDGLNIAPYEIYNIGNNRPESLFDFVNILKALLENENMIRANTPLHDFIELVPMQPGDVETTYADMTKMKEKFGFEPETSLEDGLRNFVKWYKKWMNK